ncbi:MAG: hypothetical protein ACO1OB_32365 [Archangium sp.]
MAAYDCLEIIARLHRFAKGATVSELHLFAYLGCLLSLYKGRTTTDWSYDFAGTRHGGPYSRAIQDALDAMQNNGWTRISDDFISLSDEGQQQCRELSELSQNADRTQFLAAACSTALTMPIGRVRGALASEVDLKTTSVAENARPLLDATSCSLLHDQFAVLSEAVGVSVHDLMVPAVVWITHLANAVFEERDATSDGT